MRCNKLQLLSHLQTYLGKIAARTSICKPVAKLLQFLVGKVGGVDEQSKIGNDNSIWLIF
jgi:hypothetical protein